MKKLLCCLSISMFVLLAAAGHAALPVTGDLQFHYDAGSLTLNDGDPVNLWPDLWTDLTPVNLVVGNGNGAPTFVADAWNGHPAVRFEASRSTLLTTRPDPAVNTNTWDGWGGSAEGVCVFIVCTAGDETNTQRVFQVGRTRNVANNAKSLICDVSANAGGNFFNNGSATALNPAAQGQWHISIHEIAKQALPSVSFYAVNSSTAIPFTTTGGTTTFAPYQDGNNTDMGMVMDKLGAWTPGYNGDIAEVIVYRTTLSAANKKTMYQYLYNKYNNAPVLTSPADGAIDQGTLVNGNTQADVTFTWNTSLLNIDDAGSINPDVAAHHLYVTDHVFNNEPNWAGVTPIATVPAGSPVEPNAICTVTLELDKKYYWRVGESVWENGVESEPNRIMSLTRSFNSYRSVPVIKKQPANLILMPGETGLFTITVQSLWPETYEWFMSADNSTITTADDRPLGTDANSLPVPTVTAANDEAYYFCKISNQTGPIYSAVRTLAVKRKVAHYTLDAIDTNGNHADSSGEGHDVDPWLTTAFASSAYGGLGQALDLPTDPNGAGYTATWIPTFGTNQFTVSFWLKWNGNRTSTFAYHGIVNSRSTDQDAAAADTRNWLIEITPAAVLRGTLDFTEVVKTPEAFPTGQWKHVVYTASNSLAVLYIDGAAVDAVDPSATVQQLNVPLYVGALGRSATAMTSVLNGVLDDVQIYNYMLDQTAVAALYNSASGQTVCLEYQMGAELALDVAGGGVNGDEPDCKIDMADLSAFADDWFNCGLYPQANCQ